MVGGSLQIRAECLEQVRFGDSVICKQVGETYGSVVQPNSKSQPGLSPSIRAVLGASHPRKATPIKVDVPQQVADCVQADRRGVGSGRERAGALLERTASLYSGVLLVAVLLSGRCRQGLEPYLEAAVPRGIHEQARSCGCPGFEASAFDPELLMTIHLLAIRVLSLSLNSIDRRLWVGLRVYTPALQGRCRSTPKFLTRPGHSFGKYVYVVIEASCLAVAAS